MSKRYNYVMQENNFDCGIACLQTIFKQFDYEVSRNKLLELIKVKQQGISAYELINASKKLGIDAYGVKSTIDKISNELLPCISHIIKNKNYFHYIVILENDKIDKTIKIMDPAEGISTVSYDDFNILTTNIFLIFNPNKIIKNKNTRFVKYIHKIFLENKKIIIKSLLFSIIFILFSILFNYYLKVIMSNINNNYKYLYLILIIFIGILFLKNIIDYLKNNLILKLNNRIDKKITKKVLNHIVHLPYKYYKEKSSGEIVTIINDIENFKEIVTKIFVICLINALLILIVLIYISFFSIIYSFILLIFIFITSLITIKYQYIFNDIYIKMKQAKIKYTSKIIETISAYDSVKNLNIETKIVKKINESYLNVLKNNNNYSKKYYNYIFILNTTIELFYLVLIFLASLIIINNKMDISYLALFSSVFYIVFDFMSSISDCLSTYKIYQTSINKILDVLEVPKENFNVKEKHLINLIEYKNVSFMIKEHSILNNINLSIEKGQKVFIGGKSGIGKSTMIKLLLKYYDLTKGEILINNKSIKEISLEYIRKNITYVSQDETLLCDSIINNFKIINESNKKIDIAAKTTLINEMLLRDKITYDYVLEDNGSNLSGGERKKIIITRALLKKSKVLVLDEVFNEMDVATERKILNNIFKYYPTLTVILISHRNNNKDLFNKIYELKEE